MQTTYNNTILYRYFINIMDLVLFDLDNTLLDGDSDFSWGQFLCEIGAVDEYYKKRNREFFNAYQRGKLNMTEYIKFVLQPLAQNTMPQLLGWREQFLAEKIKPMVTNEAIALVRLHLDKGDFTAIITSTNSFITEPIGKMFGIKTVIATKPKLKDGCFTGAVSGVPCFREGKIICLEEWLTENKPDYKKSWFYSDSFNDMPLLSWVDCPIVVNGDAVLMKHAKQNNWSVLSLGH